MSLANPHAQSVTTEVRAILTELQAAGTQKKRESAMRVGIPMGKAFGVSVARVRRLARQLKGRCELAEPLWATDVHEARLLAVLLADHEAVSRAGIERWLKDVVSWDLCDHLCSDLVSRRSDAIDLVRRWIKKTDLYFKRAAFAVIAQLAVHDKNMDADSIREMLRLIIQYSGDDRPHVRQAASWAVRSIGKRDETCRELAISAAIELLETEDASKCWIGRHAMRELERLIKVTERKRLLGVKSTSSVRSGSVHLDPARHRSLKKPS